MLEQSQQHMIHTRQYYHVHAHSSLAWKSMSRGNNNQCFRLQEPSSTDLRVTKATTLTVVYTTFHRVFTQLRMRTVTANAIISTVPTLEIELASPNVL